MPQMHCIKLANLKWKADDIMKEEKLIDFIDDSVDIGKEPLEHTKPEAEELYNKIMDEYK